MSRPYSDVTAPLLCYGKRLLVDPTTRAIRLYCDDGPRVVTATVAKGYTVEGLDHLIWRPVTHTSRARIGKRGSLRQGFD